MNEHRCHCCYRAGVLGSTITGCSEETSPQLQQTCEFQCQPSQNVDFCVIFLPPVFGKFHMIKFVQTAAVVFFFLLQFVKCIGVHMRQCLIVSSQIQSMRIQRIRLFLLSADSQSCALSALVAVMHLFQVSGSHPRWTLYWKIIAQEHFPCAIIPAHPLSVSFCIDFETIRLIFKALNELASKCFTN